MKYLTATIFFLLIFSAVTFSQKMDGYNFSFTVAFLPGGGGQSEVYYKNQGTISHSTSTTYYNNRNHNKGKTKSLKKDPEIEQTINQLDSLFRLTSFKFTIKKSIIDSIKADTFSNKNLKITNEEIDKFFSHGDTVFLDIKNIPNRIDFMSVIDGGPYWFNLQIKRPGQDTISYAFTGNLYDQVRAFNIKNWLPVYLAYQRGIFFPTIQMDYYFGEKNLEGILRRFIAWANEK